jgi:putative spermidine/putrescine transport system permease protein
VSVKWGKWITYVYVTLIILFMIGPLFMIFVVSFSETNMFQFPPKGFSLQNYMNLFQDDRIISSMWLSFVIGLASTLIACLVGLLAGLGIVRGKLPWKGFLESLFLGPLIIPLVTTGIGFLIIFVPLGLTGSPIAIILAHSVIISPYVVRILIASLRQFDPLQEEAAIIHGASPWYTFHTVVLPQLSPALISGAILSFLVSLDEYTVTVFLSQANTITLPIRIYQFVAVDINPLVTALASIMVIAAFIIIAVLEKRLKIHKYLSF